ncbi:MAG: hypothetical protein ACI9WU_001806 [Myxococcota bacterium]
MRHFLLPLILVLTGLASGCKKADELGPEKAAAARVKVNLPPSPEMVEPRRVERYTDGAWTVAGLVANQGELLRTDVQVKGYVHQIVRCDELVATDCELPNHAVVVDDPKRTRRRLIVVGGPDTAFDSLEEGKPMTLDGRYSRSDPEGLFVRMDGILLLAPRPVQPGDNETAP